MRPQPADQKHPPAKIPKQEIFTLFHIWTFELTNYLVMMFGDRMRYRYLLLFQITFLCIIVVYGCTVTQKTRPIHDIPFMERAQSKTDGDIRVTVAVLSAEESFHLFALILHL